MRHLKKHLEWLVFATGLLLLAFMNPENAGTSLCFFEWAGINFCPGEGLGHSISYSFRGNFEAAFQAHIAGPFAILVLSARIGSIWRNLYYQSTSTKELLHNG
ncbi:MAG TPA: DUF2752 domain-containing protein [Balneolaceae bacterium]|nr:hypothetical protein [Balneola sp.]HBQ58412.1 DUF2752 domain-containing protein [Balneolaceae bacterium]|tara:strand:+ start:76292 stop:76600 length:309 start_codon:yes stop_codon:yes gene_type:complete